LWLFGFKIPANFSPPAQGQADDKSRGGQEGEPTEDSPQVIGELAIRDLPGRNGVDRSGQAFFGLAGLAESNQLATQSHGVCRIIRVAIGAQFGRQIGGACEASAPNKNFHL
jgi:hypothetical protein